MGGIASEGAYGEFDPDTGKIYEDSSGGFDLDQVESYQNVLESMSSSDKELDIGAELDDIDPDADLIDFSNPTRDGATPLGEAGPGFDFDKLKDLPGGKGSGPKPLGDSGSLRFASEKGVTRPGGFNEEKSPYAAPKYYTPQGSVEFQKMVSGLLSNVFGSNIRKPTIRSLI